ncbi:hypothetical protein LWF15_11215 [Kineosporia rhizophila]|uniref:hypothetical protein n=1 Tax=Kineosporia rhizophila TaxID=84633 RepID=UPI001E36D417|nr:hypothetical protein [Kineosporia rhizophila]MCE0536080.1 hypothetical protein [Kineosporia rhizophila]
MADDDLWGWDSGELEMIARWHLVRGLGLPAEALDDQWSISVTREGVSCPQATKRDEARIAEAQRLLERAYPDRDLNVRRRSLTEVPRTRQAR